jgi:hypothetical protein
VVAIDLGGDSRSEMLFLTTAEARGLAGNLEVEGVGMAGDEIIVGIWPWGVEENRSGTVVRSWAKIGV